MNRVAIIIIFIFLTTPVFLFKQEMAMSEPGPENYLEPPVVYNAEGLKDPFMLPKIEENKVQLPESGLEPKIPEVMVVPPALTIQGILWGGRSAQAIINQKIVKIGDILEGARIIDIKKEGIIIDFQGQQFSFPEPALNKNLRTPKEIQNPIGGKI
jgi:hypothetical protein